MNKRLFYIVGILMIFLVSFFMVSSKTQPEENKSVISLVAPPFVSNARAETSEIGEFLNQQAGFSGWFQSGVINLDNVRLLFRTIETETSDYIIGSVPVTSTTYGELEDVHVYIHKDGWALAYYPQNSPTARIFDILYFRSELVFRTKFDDVLAQVATAAGLSTPEIHFYDFRYPNATHCMAIIETTGLISGDTDNYFIFRLPTEYEFFEGSFAFRIFGTTTNKYFNLDSTRLTECSLCYGSISLSLLSPDIDHRAAIGYVSIGAIFLVYRVP